ncbi:hypothetical protein A2U01_0116604, partial [Trifolium medium]|nr:hypothetical protein [Trifolium medium]
SACCRQATFLNVARRREATELTSARQCSPGFASHWQTFCSYVTNPRPATLGERD